MLTFALRQLTYRPEIASKQPIDYLKFQESTYRIYKFLVKQKKFMLMITLNHLLYLIYMMILKKIEYIWMVITSLKRACTMNFLQNIGDYEKMRSSFLDGQPKQRFSIDDYKHLVINNSNAKQNCQKSFERKETSQWTCLWKF